MLFTQTPPKIKSDTILCLYQNTTSHLQIIKISNFKSYEWEKVIFPGQRLFFNACENAELNVYSNNEQDNIKTDTVACEKLKVDEPI